MEIIYLFNIRSTESTEFLEKVFQKPIAEIRSDEGNYFSNPERLTDTKKRGKKAKRFLKLHITPETIVNKSRYH